jgi:hypothetical protein
MSCTTSFLTRCKFGIGLLLVLWLAPMLLQAALHTVDDGGGADFIAIPAAIGAAENGDSILVYPGTYHGLVDFQGKSLALYSLAIATGDTAYVRQTVLDGDWTSGVVKISDVDSAYVGGFRIRHGIGCLRSLDRVGGGIFAEYSTLSIEDCFIDHNVAKDGGGICILNATAHLLGNTVTLNSGAYCGGGVVISLDDSFPAQSNDPVHGIFDSVMRNDIFKNASIWGSDLAIYGCDSLSIPINKFTIISPDALNQYYYICLMNSQGVTITIEEGAIEPVSADLYVSPSGDNANSGLSASEPLRSVAYALWKIRADSLNPHVIHVASGEYSPTSTGELHPWNLKPYVQIIGEESASFDCEDRYNIAGYIHGDCYDVTHDLFGEIGLRNLSFDHVSTRNCPGIDIRAAETSIMQNIDITISSTAAEVGIPYNAICNQFTNRTEFDDISIQGNYGGLLFFLGLTNRASINRLEIVNDQVGAGFDFSNLWPPSEMVVTNSVIRDNYRNDSWPGPTCSGFNVTGAYYDIDPDSCRFTMANCTIAGNGAPTGPFSVSDHVHAEFYNTLVAGNNPNTVVLDGRYYTGEVSFTNCLFENGESDLQTWGSYYDVQTENLLSGDPLFAGPSQEYPYALSWNSPGIDAGTQTLPNGLVIPDLDAAGNPRVYGNGIDIGAYEWQGESVEDPTAPIKASNRLSIFPNPCRAGSEIRLDLANHGDVEVSIYNLRGQKVRSLMKAFVAGGSFNLRWDGRDDDGHPVGSGNYVVRMALNGDVLCKKMLIVK